MDTIHNKYTVIIADDHVSVREGLLHILSADTRLVVTDVVSDGSELAAAVKRSRPDLVITDVRMPNGSGVEIGEQLKAAYPELYLMAYTGWDTDSLFLNILKSGFTGIVLKRAGKEEVLAAVSAVLNGDVGYCNAGQRRIHQLIQRNYYNPNRQIVKQLMNERYLTIIKFIAQGLRSEQIAEKMGLGIQTIHTYRKRLLIKTGCSNPASLIQYAYSEGLIDTEE